MNKILLRILIIAFLTIISENIIFAKGTNNFKNDSLKTYSTILNYSSPNLPNKICFAGDTIDLSRFDRREKIDKEILAVTYMHSTSLQIIKRANRYFPIIDPILKEYGIPEDLKYLMVIESSINPTAKSGAGAAGLWQFMPATAKEYGLEVNNCVDERYNIEKSTIAACKYLKDAYLKYNDWASVAASYNAGQRRISSQLEKQDVANSLDLHLVEETSRYVYRILAAKLLFSNPAEFGFNLRASDLYPTLKVRTIKVNTKIEDLIDWAKEQNTTLAFLKLLNPWLRETKLENRSGKEYIIYVPADDGLYYNPSDIKPYDTRWIAE